VNPLNMRIGYHTDWAGNFPFAEVGLGDNYALPVAALSTFGFSYDPAFLKSTGARMWAGLLAADTEFRRAAGAKGLTTAQYRVLLQERYRGTIAALEQWGALEEKDNHE
jgi:hypothetical protein